MSKPSPSSLMIKSQDEIKELVAPIGTVSTVIALQISTFFVTDEASHQAACETLQWVKAQWGKVEAARQSITGPMINAKRNADAFFRPSLENYSKSEGHLKSEIARYRAKIQEERVSQATQSLPVVAPPAAIEGIQERVKQCWRVTDESKVPRNFLSVDARKIDDFLRDGGLRAIPGVEFYEETIIASSSKDG